MSKRKKRLKKSKPVRKGDLRQTPPIHVSYATYYKAHLGQPFVLKINNPLSPDHGKYSGQMTFDEIAMGAALLPEGHEDKIYPVFIEPMKHMKASLNATLEEIGMTDVEIRETSNQR